MWPTGMRELGIDLAGKISAEVSAEAGRALGRLTDLGWGPRLRLLLAGEAAGDVAHPAVPDRAEPDRPVRDRPEPDGPVPDGPVPDGPVPDDVVAAVVKVLAAWNWAQRPAAVIAVPSRTRPQLITSLAGQLARIGRMPFLGALECAGKASAARQHNSAQRLRGVWASITVPDAMRAELARLDGPVLLVDDRVETGWTMTVAAMRLREAGAAAVLPLVLATAAA
jgi:ATP-dependent DNA helicase RecQ